MRFKRDDPGRFCDDGLGRGDVPAVDTVRSTDVLRILGRTSEELLRPGFEPFRDPRGVFFGDGLSREASDEVPNRARDRH